MFIAAEAQGAALPITPSGLNTQVSAPIVSGSGSTQTTQYNITGGTRPGGAAGTNVFHSFGNFDVPTNNIANFLNSGSVDLAGHPLGPGLPTSNILGRVTAGNPSVIFGMIQTNGPGGFGNANLFLMNPAGFLFGPNATINVGGMVAFTTADYLRLEGIGANGTFYADPGKASVLTTAPVAAFGFLGSNPAAIAIQGSTLKVADGQTLSLVGGNQGFTATDPDTGDPINMPGGITMTGGKLLAPGGQINLVSVASPGEVLYPSFNYGPNVNGAQFTSLGNISLSDGALIDVSANQAGTVKIRGGQLRIADATVSADTQNANGAPVAIDVNIAGDMSIAQTTSAPALSARTTGTGDAGEIRISSNNLTVINTSTDVQTVAIDTHTSGEGRAGNVKITTGNLDVSNSSSALAIFIDSGTDGFHNAHGGDVTITATRFNDTSQAIGTGGSSNRIQGGDTDGSSGNVTITANEIQLIGATISTDVGSSGLGVAGNITFDATNMTTAGALVSATGWQHGGTITIHANNLSITEASSIGNVGLSGPSGAINISANSISITNGSTLESDVGGDGDAGPINITATNHLTLSGNLQTELPGVGIIGRPTGIFSNSFGVFGTNGNAGTITIATPSLVMTDGSRINTSTLANGSGGDVIINAQSISMSGTLPSLIPEPLFAPGSIHPGGIVTVTTGESCPPPCGGNAGNITITTNQLNVAGGAEINSGTSSSGHGGTIAIHARDSIAITGMDSSGLASGVQSLSTGTTAGSGAGGNIALVAGQTVSISDGASVSASTTGPGNAGNILVQAGDISITGGGTITAASMGSGNAGTVTIQGLNSPANSFLVDGAGSGVFTTTSDAGTGGNITIDSNAVTLQNGAHLSSSSTGPGSTGNIQINAGNQFTMNNASVTTEANQAGGGAIKITTNPNGTVQLTNSMVSASVLDGNGGGGSVNIDPQFVILQNSQILAQAVQGPGGNISITTNLLLPDSASLISASSQFGQQGNIVIQSPISPASGKIVPLSQKPLIATSLLSQRCAALAGGNISSFTLAGRDTLPAEPGNWFSAPLALTTSGAEGGTVREADNMTSDETPLLSVRKIAPPGFLVQAFAVESTGCQS